MINIKSCAYGYISNTVQNVVSNQLKPTAASPSNAGMSSIAKTAITFVVCMSGISAHAAIISDNSERRIEVRYGSSSSVNTNSSNAYRPSTAVTNNNAGGTTILRADRVSGDSMQGLIQQKQREFEYDAKLSIEESQSVNIIRRTPSYNTTYNTTYSDGYSTSNNNYNSATGADFNSWLNSDRYRVQQVNNYQRYLNSQVGAQNVPPLSQLLTTARSWDKCGYEPYQLPPQELWSNIIPTLRLYSALKNQGILPASSEIRSVYRSPGLNDCAGGADASKHMTAGAIDIWVPEYENNLWRLNSMQDGLCQFWQYQGESYNFGLGLYSTGAIHLDTQGYRKWGFNNASSSSACRY